MPDPSSADGQNTGALNLAVRQQLLLLAYQNNAGSIFTNFVTGSCQTYLLSVNGYDPVLTFGWYGTVLLLTAVRFWGNYLFQRQRNENIRTERSLTFWKRCYEAGLAAGASLWAIMAVFGLSGQSSDMRFMTLITMSALASGATGVLAPVLRAGRIYICVIFLSCTTALLLIPDPPLVLAALALFFMSIMLITHGKNHEVLQRSITLQLDNDELVHSLQQKNEEMIDLNRSLEQRVDARTTQLRELAHRDTLTGLLNRSGFTHGFNSLEGDNRASDFAVVFIDLDNFKQINDGMGHDVGDAVLQSLSNRLQSLLPPGNLLARWGGDEFILLLVGHHERIAGMSADVTEMMRRATVAPVEVEGRIVYVGFSAGIAFGKFGKDRIGSIVQNADLAITDVKKSAKGSVKIYAEHYLSEQKRRLLLSQALRQALQQDQLHLVFQPIVSANRGVITGYESLLRWTHPQLGFISPAEFIPLAEETGQITDIGRWVLRKACSSAVGWPEELHHARIAVNVSVKQIVAKGFVAMVKSILAETGLAPQRLVLEVTESVFEDGLAEQIYRDLGELNLLGIRIHIDDFGTGYSSLSRLHDMRLDAVKIDQSFIRKLDDHSRAIIEAIVLISKRFGIETIAEGVETLDQARQLRTMGVDKFQGYYFSRPAEISDETIGEVMGKVRNLGVVDNEVPLTKKI